ncbi:MAG: PAS domain-containing protein, partial [Chitinophagaceae bacterium]
MSVKNNTQDRLDNLEHLSQYAGYLLDKFSVEFASLLLRFSQEANLPVLKLLTHLTQEQLQELTIQNTTELLEALHGNKGRRLIEDTLQRFVSNRLPNIDNHTIVTEDILLSATARRQVFLHFLPDYASSIIQAVDVIRDLDVYMLYSQTALTNAHANLLQQKIEESSRFIQSVNTTLPGAVYIFDPKTFQNVYATPKLESVIGYTVAELNAFSRAASNEIVHEEDQGEMNDHLANVMKCADGEIYSYKYRVKLKTGAYRWIRNYETPFQRDSEGKVTQTIAIALNIDKEKRTAEDLKHREADLVAAQQLFNQAQALSHFGHYSMNLETREIVFTEEASRIYGFDSKRSVFQYEEIVSLIEPEDKDKVRQALWQTIATREPFDYHFRITNHKGENKTLHSLGTIVNTEGDNSGNLVGTVQDVTERHGLLRQLLESEKLYKQAQALAHLGNWTLDFRTGEYILSDEMYRIYERSPGEPFLSNDWQDFIHPE